MYTDGSKDSRIGLKTHVEVGIVIREFKINISKIISNNVAVYTAELVAIYLGLQWV